MASRILWVELDQGGAGLAKLRAQCSPELRAAIDAGIVKAAWYPLPLFIELCERIDQIFGAGDRALIRALGRHGADANLTTIYRLFFKVGTVHWILGRAVRLWSAHYDTGYLEVMTRGPKSALARVRGFATPHPVHCLSVEGWCERSIELSGGAGAKVTETKCRTRGDDLCQFELTWA